MFPPDKPTGTFPYAIEAQIGSGSMGIVYRARDVDLDRMVAIKTLRDGVSPGDADDEVRRRFLQEARAAAQLSHPGVAVVHRVAEEDGSPFIVMEWIEGRTLEAVVNEDGPRSLEETARLVIALLEALEVGHAAGIVHRDIKPANLMVLGDGRIKVTDFGIALMKGRELVQTQAGVVLATPQFASPEQLRGGEVDARSDLYATGVLTYHLLTGAYPFHGKSFLELANAVLQNPPVPLSQHLPGAPAALEGLVHKALEKDRRQRFQTAREMIDALRPFLGTDLEVSRAGTPANLEQMPTEIIRQSYSGLPAEVPLALVEFVSTWPCQKLEERPVAVLLAQLLEKPLHAPAFAGAAIFGDICLFLEDGVLLGAVDRRTGETGDAVAERLPETSDACLHALPDVFSRRLTVLLATALHPPRRRQSDLDSTFINLPVLSGKLHDEKFSGFLRLERGNAWGLLAHCGGELAVSLFSKGWGDVPVERSWVNWVAEHPVRAHVEEKVVAPVANWYRHALKNLDLVVEMTAHDGEEIKKTLTTSTTGSRIRELFRTPRTDSARVLFGIHPAEGAAARLAEVGYEKAPAFQFLSWSLRELPPYFAERQLTGGWKYLSEWLALVEKARLYHDLERPDSRESDFFDLVTEDGKGKVLHLAERRAQPTEADFEAFLERVVAAKQARIKTGDVGGVFYVARHFNDEVLAAYARAIVSGTGNWLKVEEAFTGYAGFVRIGPRRGFHLLLVEEKDDGYSPLILG